VKILAFYTASDPASVALRTPEAEASREVAGRRAVEALVAEAARLLLEAGLGARRLDSIALVRGPGSFTGLRVGAAAALGLARGSGVPLVAIGTLEPWAAAAFADPSLPRRCQVALDARRGEVYMGTFEALSARADGEALVPMRAVDRPRALPLAQAAAGLEAGVALVGDAREALLDLAAAGDRPGFSRAQASLSLWIARLVAAGAAGAIQPDELVLDYLRQPQAVARASGPAIGGA
jgi:tRNA threonylcarbamoyladenosine biosynthesis protein TsaB